MIVPIIQAQQIELQAAESQAKGPISTGRDVIPARPYRVAEDHKSYPAQAVQKPPDARGLPVLMFKQYQYQGLGPEARTPSRC